ncbi:unnamed protein product, partial [Pelagomonas calceolata]
REKQRRILRGQESYGRGGSSASAASTRTTDEPASECATTTKSEPSLCARGSGCASASGLRAARRARRRSVGGEWSGSGGGGGAGSSSKGDGGSAASASMASRALRAAAAARAAASASSLLKCSSCSRWKASISRRHVTRAASTVFSARSRSAARLSGRPLSSTFSSIVFWRFASASCQKPAWLARVTVQRRA